MSFLEALKNQAAKVEAKHAPRAERTPTPQEYAIANPSSAVAEVLAPRTIEDVKPLTVTVEVVDNRDRLDVWFSQKPADSILNQLRNNGWWYRPSDRAWFHKDTEENRQFLRVNFGNSIEPKDGAPEAIATPEIVVTEPEREESPIEPEPDNSKFGVYARQVEELCASLKVRAADLQLIAIDRLHKSIFTRN